MLRVIFYVLASSRSTLLGAYVLQRSRRTPALLLSINIICRYLLKRRSDVARSASGSILSHCFAETRFIAVYELLHERLGAIEKERKTRVPEYTNVAASDTRGENDRCNQRVSSRLASKYARASRLVRACSKGGKSGGKSAKKGKKGTEEKRSERGSQVPLLAHLPSSEKMLRGRRPQAALVHYTRTRRVLAYLVQP
ncbi:hypothetical protein DFH06DRAFT_568766 [Mycena polygramma]|nr:hypothetical protein DFH06DRAFT_568766 [Mycena polygramma]